MNRKEVASYGKNQNKKLSNQKIGQINIFVKDPFVNEIDHEIVFKKIDQLLPDHILELVDIIYIGEFDHFKKKNANATYSDGAIYVDHKQENENDLIDDVIHEFAHASEDGFAALLYEDDMIKQSFIDKRIKLKKTLRYENYSVDDYDLKSVDYNNALDQFFFREVGYEKLGNLTQGLFLGPYSATSLREYFARGFEEYYLGNRDFLKDVCPYIYKKLFLLDSLQNEENNIEY